ncbi:MAG: hypothetical protein IJQ81_12615 [Oscillibacter sp.]|nr:hypothetical protein [Oscillibacter sp.]
METKAMCEAMLARYRKEQARLARCEQRVAELKAEGVSGNRLSSAKNQVWKRKTLLRGMRSMANAVGLDLPAL